MNDTPLSPWIIGEKSGNIPAAHCNCIAGLCESCSHIGLVLFYIEYPTQIHDSKTCTEGKAYWLLPGYHSVEHKKCAILIFQQLRHLRSKTWKQK